MGAEYAEPAKPFAQWTPAEVEAHRAWSDAELKRHGFVLDGKLQGVVDAQAADLVRRARVIDLPIADVFSAAKSDFCEASMVVDSIIRDALDSLSGAGVEKPLGPLAWALHVLEAPGESDAEVLAAVRAADSYSLVSAFNVAGDDEKPALRDKLRRRGLIRQRRVPNAR